MPPKFMNFQSLWRLVLGTSYFGLLSKGEESLFIHYNGAINVSYLYFCFPYYFGKLSRLDPFLSSEEINGPPGFLLRIF
jgi:hypothetical protein